MLWVTIVAVPFFFPRYATGATLLRFTTSERTSIFVSRLLYWLCIGLLWLYAHKAEHQDLLLYKDKPYPFTRYVVSVVILLLILFGGSVVVGLLLKLVKPNQSSTRMAELMQILRRYPALLVFTSLTAGVTEEIMFRGYLQTRFNALFGKPYLSIIISSLLFGLLHFRYGTVANMLIPFFIGFVFAFYYQKYRNIKVLMICHFVWDMAVSLVWLNIKHT